MTKPGELTEKKINIVWDGMEEDSSNGVIAILNFSKPKKAGSYDVKISYEDGGIIDGNLQPVEVTMYNGSITVKGFSEGEKDSCTVNGHKGGKATCIKKAVCSVCRKEYGEVDPTTTKGNRTPKCQESNMYRRWKYWRYLLQVLWNKDKRWKGN